MTLRPHAPGYESQDPYAAHRCACGHLVYRDDLRGGPCRFCECQAHGTDRPLEKASDIPTAEPGHAPHGPGPVPSEEVKPC